MKYGENSKVFGTLFFQITQGYTSGDWAETTTTRYWDTAFDLNMPLHYLTHTQDSRFRTMLWEKDWDLVRNILQSIASFPKENVWCTASKGYIFLSSVQKGLIPC